MKILRVIARLNIGGPAIQAISLTRAFNSRGFKSQLVFGVPGAKEGDLSGFARGLPTTTIPTLSRELSLARDLISLGKLLRIVRGFSPDIIHTHTAKAGAIGRLAAILTNTGVCVHTFHGHIFSGYFGPFKTQSFLTIERTLAKRTAAIVALSTSQRAELVEKYRIADLQKCHIIPLGFDLAPFTEVARNRTYSLGKKIRIGWVGRLVPIKNPRAFLRFSQLVNQSAHCRFSFAFVGGGAMESELKKEVETLNLSAQVEFLGWQREMPRVYSQLDLVVLTSLNEGTPVALIEAMASGIPVIAFDAGGTKDIVLEGETGFLVNSTESLVERTQQLLGDERLYANLGRRAAEYARSKFNFERLVNDHRSLYLRLLEQNN